MFVLDLDNKNGVNGVEWLAEKIEEHGEWPNTVEALSPSGGWHVYFQYPDFDPKTCESEIAPGVDVRAHGGMVIAPPSVKPGAEKTYRWKNPPGLFDVARAPQWVLEMLPRREEPKLADTGFQIDTGGVYENKSEKLAQALNDCAADGRKHKGVRTVAAMLGQRGLCEDLIAAVVRHACPVWDKNVENSIRSGVAMGPQAPQDRKSRFYSAASLKGKPLQAREWLVPDMVPQKTVSLFYGDGGTGKSLLTLQLAFAVAADTTWIGRTVNTGGVIFLSAEDDEDELHRRIADTLRATGKDYDDIERLTLRSLVGEDALLAVESQLKLIETELFRELDARASEEAPTLIVIDTLADVFPSNENERNKARQFIGILKGQAARQECAVMVLGHPSLTGVNTGTGTSGSTGWNNSASGRLYFERVFEEGREPDPNARRLTTKKNNYGPIGEEIGLRWQDGVFVAQEQGGMMDALAKNAKCERVFLKLLDEFRESGRRVRHTAGHGYAPTEFAKSGQAEGLGKTALRAAMNALFHRGEIEVAKEGPPSRPSSYIRRANR